MRLTLNVQAEIQMELASLHNAEWGKPWAFGLSYPLSQVWCIKVSCFLSLQFNYLELISFSGFLGGSVVKNPPAMQETQVQSLGWEDSLEEEMASHSTILAWRIPWTEEPGWLQSRGSQRVGHYWETFTLSPFRSCYTHGPPPFFFFFTTLRGFHEKKKKSPRLRGGVTSVFISSLVINFRLVRMTCESQGMQDPPRYQPSFEGLLTPPGLPWCLRW